MIQSSDKIMAAMDSAYSGWRSARFTRLSMFILAGAQVVAAGLSAYLSTGSVLGYVTYALLCGWLLLVGYAQKHVISTLSNYYDSLVKTHNYNQEALRRSQMAATTRQVELMELPQINGKGNTNVN